MADSSSTKPAPASKRPTLLPQAEHAGKPAMPLGAHLFTLIGARNRAHLHLLSSTISRNHACIIASKGGIYVRDLASRNGVIVNGRKVRESELRDGDLIQFGSFKFKLQEPPGPIRLATTPPAPLAMLEMDGRALTPMDDRAILIGRRPGCDIALDSPAVSNTHAIIFECDGKRYVRDLGSRTGTQVNGNTVHQQALEIGDQIKIGSTSLRYIAADMPPVEAGEISESLPLEMEPATVDHGLESPIDLHFDDRAIPLAAEPEPTVQAEAEPIPLIEPAAEHAETDAPLAVAGAPEIDFAAEHSIHSIDPATGAPAEDQVPLPVEEEIPLIQQQVTAPAAVIAEPAEELSEDVWTPEPEQTATAHIASTPAIDGESIAIEPEPTEAELTVAPPDKIAAPPPEIPVAEHEGIPQEIAPEEAGNASDLSTIDFTQHDESSGAERSILSAEIRDAATAEVPGAESEPEAFELEAAEEFAVASELPIEHDASVEEVTPTATSELAHGPTIDESEGLMAEPEVSPLQWDATPQETALAESAELPQANQPAIETGEVHIGEPEVAVDEHPAETAADIVEEQATRQDESASSLPEPIAVSDIASQDAAYQPDVETASSSPIEEALPESEALSTAVTPASIDGEMHVTAPAPVESFATVDVTDAESQEAAATATVVDELVTATASGETNFLPSSDQSSSTSGPSQEGQAATPEPIGASAGMAPEETNPSVLEPEPGIEGIEAADGEQAAGAASSEPEALVSPIAEETPAIVDVAESTTVSAGDLQTTVPAPTESAEVTPLQVKDVDLSTVTFGAETGEAEIAADFTPDTSSEPVPLLDLLPSPPAQPIEPVRDEGPPQPSHLPPAPSTKRPTRPSRRKTGAGRMRRKKNETVVEAAPRAMEKAETLLAGEALPAEASAIDVASSGTAAGFTASEPAPLAELEASIATEPLPSIEAAGTDQPVTNESAGQDASSTAQGDTEALLAPKPLPQTESAEAAPLIASEPALHDAFSAAQDFHAAEAAPAVATDEWQASPETVEPALPPEQTEPILADLPASEEMSPTIASASLTSTDSVREAESAPSPESIATLDETRPEVESAAANPMPPGAETETSGSESMFSMHEASGIESALDIAEEPPTETSEMASHVEFLSPREEVADVATASRIETIEVSEPTPASALDLESSLPLDDESAPTAPPDHPDGLLSDSAFGQIVTGFASVESGPLVDETNAAVVANAPPIKEGAELQRDEVQILAPLGDADIPPLELGEALKFGSDDSSSDAPATLAEQNVVTGDELTLDPPAVSDVTTSPVTELEFTASDDIEPALELEPPSDFADPLSQPVIEEPSFDAGLEWEEPIALAPQVDERGLEFEELSAPPAPVPAAGEETSASLPSAPAAPAIAEVAGAGAIPPAAEPNYIPSTEVAPEAPRRPPPMNPFFGMERDLGSFIGGMPLPLAAPPPQIQSAQAPATVAGAAPATVAIPAAPSVAARPAPITPDQSGLEFDFDKLLDQEEPLELFEETADQLDKLPDSLDPISDVGNAIGERSQMGEATHAVETSIAPAPLLRSLTADASSAAPKPAPTSMAVPPFAGAGRAARPAGNPFAGLSGLRPTDVFSQTTFPPMDEPAFKAQPIDIPPMSPGKLAAVTHAPPPGSDSGQPPFKTDADAIAASPPPPRPMAPRPTAAMLVDESSDRRPWWKNIRVLLPLLILFIIAAVVAIIRFVPPKKLVQGTLQIKGIDDRDLGVYARREQIDRIRLALKQPTLREAVLQRLQSEQISPGFVQEPNAFAQLADPSNSPFEDSRLILQLPQTDAQDPQRMQAVLQALYLVSKTAAEQTSHVRQQATTATDNARALADRVKAQQDELNKMSDQLKTTTGPAVADLLRDPVTAVQTLQQQNSNLQRALAQANADVQQKHDDWERIQDAAHQGASVDPKVLQLRQTVSSLKSRLTVARLSGGTQGDPAKAFEESISDIDRDLTLIAAANSKDATLANYIARARKATAEIHAMLDAENQDSARIEELRQQLAAHREAHLRQVWAADETLKGLLEERDAQAHRFGAASDSGYAQEATRIRGVLDELDQKIEARRQSLAADLHSSDDLQQNLEQTLDRQQEDRRTNDGQINAALAQLDIPAAGKLQPGDEQMLESIGKELATAKAAHEQYANGANKPLASDGEAQVHKLEGEIAEQQAQLDAYEQRSDAKAAVATAREALDASQDAEAKAQAAYASNLNQLTIARRYKDQQMRVNDSIAARDAADRDAQAQTAEAGATPVLLPPDPQNAVQSISEPDQRVWYLAGAIGLIVVVFAGPLWLAARETRSDSPYPAFDRQRAGRAQLAAANDPFSPLDDDEHPALT